MLDIIVIVIITAATAAAAAAAAIGIWYDCYRWNLRTRVTSMF